MIDGHIRTYFSYGDHIKDSMSLCVLYKAACKRPSI